MLALALFSLIGLVIDGGRAVAAQSTATGEAEQAARLGADQISVQAVRLGTVAIDPAGATRSADAYLRAVGVAGTVTVVGQTVSVRIESWEPTVVLGIIGIQHIGILGYPPVLLIFDGVTRDD